MIGEIYDPLVESIYSDTLFDIALMNEEFIEWIRHQNEVIHEENQTWFVKWRMNATSSLNNNMAQFKKYINSQIAENKQWLIENKDLLTKPNQYPLKVNIVDKKTFNFKTAISRLSKPMTASINGIDLNSVEIPVPNTKQEVNIFLKSQIVSQYKGSDNFAKYCKDYFSCPYKKHAPNLQQMNALLDQAYQYCNNIHNNINLLQQDLNALLGYIRTDPLNKTKATPQSDLEQLKAAQQRKQAVASSSPQRNVQGGNVVNASAELFMEYYFNEVDQVQQAQTAQVTNPVPQAQMANVQKTGGNAPANQQQVQQNPQQQQQQNMQNNQQQAVPNNNDITKRKQLVCDIYKDAFNAKMSAVGEIYRAMLLLMRRHVASYKGNDGLGGNKK